FATGSRQGARAGFAERSARSVAWKGSSQPAQRHDDSGGRLFLSSGSRPPTRALHGPRFRTPRHWGGKRDDNASAELTRRWRRTTKAHSTMVSHTCTMEPMLRRNRTLWTARDATVRRLAVCFALVVGAVQPAHAQLEEE